MAKIESLGTEQLQRSPLISESNNTETSLESPLYRTHKYDTTTDSITKAVHGNSCPEPLNGHFGSYLHMNSTYPTPTNGTNPANAPGE